MNGHIYKRGDKYTYVIDIGKDPITGKRRQVSKGGFRTKKEAELGKNVQIAELTKVDYIRESSILFRDYADEWLVFYEATKPVKVSTVRVRMHEIGRLKNHFKDAKLSAIDEKLYQKMLIDLKKDFSENTLKGIHITGKMIFKKALKDKLIKVDPTADIIIPKSAKTLEEMEKLKELPKYFELRELKQFLSTIKQHGSHQDYCIFLLLAYSGLRIGELCALKWDDLNDGYLKIYKTYYNPTNNTVKYSLLTTKTESSRREIDIDDFVISELVKLKNQQIELKLKIGVNLWHDNFMFTKLDKNFGYPHQPKIVGLKMKQYLKLTGINEKSHLTPHSLRHTHVSLLAQAGVSLEEIQDRLGHKGDEVTRDIYLHITADMKKEASRKFSQLMKGLN